MQPTPTGDRLAAPPTVAPADRTQADEGAQVYWLNCQPCHGDVGQGLTDALNDDWRAQYPVEDHNCWESRCHGDRPYDDGFTLPRTVPAVIGPGALARFATAAELQGYIRQAMPFHAPGSLSEPEYWALTAFLLRANALPEAAGSLDAASAAELGLHGALATATPPPPAGPGPDQAGGLVLGGALLIVGLAAALGVWMRRQRRPQIR
jgi:cytochrome c